MTFVYILVAILILLFMITIHELGHYVAGRLLGFKINEFSVGFGKALFKRTSKKTGIVYAVRMIPLGGYCAFDGDDAAAGEENARAEAGDREVKNGNGLQFSQQRPWKRLIVLFSGAFFNFLSAIIFSIILLMSIGYNQFLEIGKIEGPNNIAVGGVLQQGDKVCAVDGHKFTILNGFSTFFSDYKENDKVVLTIDRNGVVFKDEATIVKLEKGRYGLGIEEYEVGYYKMGFGAALGKAFVFCFELAWLVIKFLGLLIAGKLSLASVGGTISTVTVMTQAISQDAMTILLLVPLISVNLAVFNLLPIPALDGARMVFVGIEWIRGKPVNPKLEAKIHMIGLLILFGLVIFLDLNFLLFSRFILYACLRL